MEAPAQGRREEGREGFAAAVPEGRDGGEACAEDDDAADDGASGVHVSAAGDGAGEGVGVACEVVGGGPEGEGDGIRAGDATAVAEEGGGLLRGGVSWEGEGTVDAGANGPGWGLVADGGEEVQRGGWVGVVAGRGDEGRGDGDGDGAGGGLGVGVGGDGSGGGACEEGRQVVGEEGTEWSDAHGGAIAEGAHAVEEGLCLGLPVCGVVAGEAGKQGVHGRAVAASRVVAFGETDGEGLLGNGLVSGQGLDDVDGHEGVVGDGPGWGGECEVLALVLGEGEEALAEGVAGAEAFEREEGEIERILRHRVAPHTFLSKSSKQGG